MLSNNFVKAIKDTLGYDIDEFDRRFRRYLRKKYLPVLMDKKSPDDHGSEIGFKKPGVFTFSPSLSPSGELVAVLGSPSRLDLDLIVLSVEDGSEITQCELTSMPVFDGMSTAAGKVFISLKDGTVECWGE